MRQCRRQNRYDQRRVRRGGFTLVECLIASVVLAFITMAVAYGLNSTRQNAKFIEERRAQVGVCNALVAQLAAMRYDGPDKPLASDSLDALNGYSDLVTGDGAVASGNPELDGSVYERRVKVETMQSFAGSGGKAGVVTVTVTGPSGELLVRRRVVPVTP